MFLEPYKPYDNEKEPQTVVTPPKNFTFLVKWKTLYVCINMIKYHRLRSEDKTSTHIILEVEETQTKAPTHFSLWLKTVSPSEVGPGTLHPRRRVTKDKKTIPTKPP